MARQGDHRDAFGLRTYPQIIVTPIWIFLNAMREVPRCSTALACRGKILTVRTSATRSGVPGSALHSSRAQDLTRWQTQTSPEPRAELGRRAHTRAPIIEDRYAIGCSQISNAIVVCLCTFKLRTKGPICQRQHPLIQRPRVRGEHARLGVNYWQAFRLPGCFCQKPWLMHRSRVFSPCTPCLLPSLACQSILCLAPAGLP